ncbi:hypothetical protein L1887_33007 [Cichorium endivia]|nr:hypothetical protein L1887_33007 [Cichorium endivia]
MIGVFIVKIFERLEEIEYGLRQTHLSSCSSSSTAPITIKNPPFLSYIPTYPFPFTPFFFSFDSSSIPNGVFNISIGST